jgi:hypothetical protein
VRKTAPLRTPHQYMDALDRANDVRMYRANLKRDLKAGRMNIIELLLDPPQKIFTMKILELMLSVPKMGRIKVDKLLRQIKISPVKTVGGMTPRQRNELILILRKR